MAENDDISVLVLGSQGMVGSALVRTLCKKDRYRIITGSREEVDLLCQKKTYEFIERHKPDWVIVAAAKVGGILANSSAPGEFLHDNLSIELNAIEGARRAGVTRLIFLGSSCIYPKSATPPFKEESLLTGALEPANEAYAIAKVAGVKLCEAYSSQYGLDYRALVPSNLYGPGDTYDPIKSHVIPGLIHRLHKAVVGNHSEVKVWGTGSPRREFLYVDDCADAVIHVMSISREEFRAVLSGNCHLNIGSGVSIAISELAAKIKSLVGYDGSLVYEPNVPNGTLVKVMSIERLESLGWEPKVGMEQGLEITYADFKSRFVNS